MSPDLRKADESRTETRYARGRAKGWIALAFGLTAGFVGLDLASLGDWAMAAFGTFLALLGLWSILYRVELVLDFASRRYRYRKGFLGSREEREGAFDDIGAVILKHEVDREGREDWEVELSIDGLSSPVEVAESGDREDAREEAERLADRIGVSLRETSED